MDRVFKTRYFHRWMLKTSLSDRALCAAVAEMRRGLIDADLGGGVVKKRIALPRRGKSGSSRALLATNKVDRWFFVFGFEKSDRANITAAELKVLQKLASDLLKLTSSDLDTAVAAGTLWEICQGDENES